MCLLWLDFNINKLYLLPSPSWSPVTVPCQLRASVQQHEEERDQTLGACCDLQHVNLPFCLHWNRYCTYILNKMHVYNWLLNTFEKLHVKGTWRYFYSMEIYSRNVVSLQVCFFTVKRSLVWFLICSGVCGFLTFGSSVSQDVLMSYPPDDIAVAIARAFIIVCVVTSYPILHFCGR